MSSSDNNNGILNDQPINVSTGTNAKHIAIGVGIAILVLVLTGAAVYGIYTFMRGRRGGYTRRHNSRTNNARNYSSQKKLPSMETRMTTPTTQKTPRLQTWGSSDSTKSVDDMIKKPEPVKGDDNNV